MFCTALSFSLSGIEAIPIRVEADVSPGLPAWDLVGYLSSEVKEAKERVRIAMKNGGFPVPPKKITVNLSPADLRKEGTSFDLAIAMTVMAGLELVPAELLEGVAFMGELSLDGTISPVPGVLSAVSEAKKMGLRRILVPIGNMQEAMLIKDMDILGVGSLSEALDSFLCGDSFVPSTTVNKQSDSSEHRDSVLYDFKDIRGQFLAKRAAEICAAGRHNLLLMGPPGTGKSMLARCIPGILPRITKEEQLELMKIYSVAGMLQDSKELPSVRPFRAPHHTISGKALIGGGVIPKPGEISLACHGVLFLDEFTEFQRNSIEVLRQPLEEKQVRITRLHGATVFPANVSLVAAMNPCPCGYYPNRERCNCSIDRIRRYLGKISQPIMDRMDLCAEMSSLSFEEMANVEVESESSLQIRERVERAVAIQKERYREVGVHFNGELNASQIREFCALSKECAEFLEKSFRRKRFSARGYHRMIRVARTIADLAGEHEITVEHLREALFYHTPDLKYAEVM